MKKYVLFLFCFFTTAAMAQIGQGRFLVGGSLGVDFGREYSEFRSQNVIVRTTQNYTEFSFNPTVGYFFTDALALGLAVDVFTRSVEGNHASTIVGVGPFARYYLPINLFFEGYFGLASRRGGNNRADTGLGYSLGVGYALFLNDHVALEPALRFRGYALTDGDNRDLNNGRFGTLLSIGFQIYL